MPPDPSRTGTKGNISMAKLAFKAERMVSLAGGHQARGRVVRGCGGTGWYVACEEHPRGKVTVRVEVGVTGCRSRRDPGGLQAEGMRYRNDEHRMTAAERENTWVGEEKSGGRRLEVPQKGCLKVIVKDDIQSK